MHFERKNNYELCQITGGLKLGRLYAGYLDSCTSIEHHEKFVSAVDELRKISNLEVFVVIHQYCVSIRLMSSIITNEDKIQEVIKAIEQSLDASIASVMIDTIKQLTTYPRNTQIPNPEEPPKKDPQPFASCDNDGRDKAPQMQTHSFIGTFTTKPVTHATETKDTPDPQPEVFSKYQYYIDELQKTLRTNQELLTNCNAARSNPALPIYNNKTKTFIFKDKVIKAIEAEEANIATLNKMKKDEPITEEAYNALLVIPSIGVSIGSYAHIIPKQSLTWGR